MLTKSLTLYFIQGTKYRFQLYMIDNMQTLNVFANSC